MAYWDINKILVEEERVPCLFTVDAQDLGHLDSKSRPKDLPAGSKVDLPLWMAQGLAEKNMVELQVPRHFGSRMRDEIMAGD